MSIPRLLSACEAITDPHIARWLRYAITRLRNGESCAPVLALEGDAALDQRDYHLRRAASEIDAETPWRAAGQLVRLVHYLGAHPELEDRYLDLDGPLREVVAAALCGPLPGSQKQLFRCLRDNRTGIVSLDTFPTATGQINSEHEFLTATG